MKLWYYKLPYTCVFSNFLLRIFQKSVHRYSKLWKTVLEKWQNMLKTILTNVSIVDALKYWEEGAPKLIMQVY